MVAVKQKDPLMKFEKLWNSQVLAIEDPFELSHNLGSGLSRRMWLYIQRCFARARAHFGLPSSRLPNGPNNLQVDPSSQLLNSKASIPFGQEYFFNPGELARGRPPPPRGKACYECGRLGHLGAQCPRRGLGGLVQGLRCQPDMAIMIMPFANPHVQEGGGGRAPADKEHRRGAARLAGRISAHFSKGAPSRKKGQE